MYEFIKNTKELAASVQAFMASPEYWRDAIGNNPKYFVHLHQNNKAFFGLSKFCAFRDISLEDYVVGLRSTTGGGKTQKHIKKICNTEWVPLSSTSSELQKQFREWFESITGGRIGYEQIHIITINDKINVEKDKRRQITPEELQNRLAAQNKIGAAGEEIAMRHEINRLRALGVAAGEADVVQVSLQNVAAGFDIRSKYRKDIRYIEVKSSTSVGGAIYVSPNELSTLKKHGDSAYLYVVHVTDVRKKEGKVIIELKNPFNDGQDTDWLKPCLFAGVPPNDESQG
jgi:hypothetical protein